MSRPYRPLHAPAVLGADIVWKTNDSASDSDSDNDSDEGSRGDWDDDVELGGQAASPEKLRALRMDSDTESGSESDGSSDSECSPSGPSSTWNPVKSLPSIQVRSKQALAFQPPAGETPSACCARPRVPLPILPAEAAPRNSFGLVPYLRDENARIREAIIRLQREAEAILLASEDEANDSNPIDFAHLLSLAKDLGDGLGCIGIFEESVESCGEDQRRVCDVVTAPEGAISISTPRSEKREELERSRIEAARLREECARSEAEEAELRCQLGIQPSVLAMVSAHC